MLTYDGCGLQTLAIFFAEMQRLGHTVVLEPPYPKLQESMRLMGLAFPTPATATAPAPIPTTNPAENHRGSV